MEFGDNLLVLCVVMSGLSLFLGLACAIAEKLGWEN